MKKRISIIPIIIYMVTLISFIYINKYIYLAPNLYTNIGLLVYSFTYLLLAVLYKKSNIKSAKDTIYYCFIMFLLFYLIVSILNTVNGIINSQLISQDLRNLFTPNSFKAFSIYVYYPNIASLLTYSLVFFVSHYIFITIYEAIEGITNYLISFIISILIGFILDQLLYSPLAHIPYLIDGSFQYKELIKLMTANFIIAIFASLIMVTLYLLIQKKVNK